MWTPRTCVVDFVQAGESAQEDYVLNCTSKRRDNHQNQILRAYPMNPYSQSLEWYIHPANGGGQAVMISWEMRNHPTRRGHQKPRGWDLQIDCGSWTPKDNVSESRTISCCWRSKRKGEARRLGHGGYDSKSKVIDHDQEMFTAFGEMGDNTKDYRQVVTKVFLESVIILVQYTYLTTLAWRKGYRLHPTLNQELLFLVRLPWW